MTWLGILQVMLVIRFSDSMSKQMGQRSVEGRLGERSIITMGVASAFPTGRLALSNWGCSPLAPSSTIPDYNRRGIAVLNTTLSNVTTGKIFIVEMKNGYNLQPEPRLKALDFSLVRARNFSRMKAEGA